MDNEELINLHKELSNKIEDDNNIIEVDKYKNNFKKALNDRLISDGTIEEPLNAEDDNFNILNQSLNQLPLDKELITLVKDKIAGKDVYELLAKIIIKTGLWKEV